MDLIYATEGQICRALLNAIATHRDFKNAQVFYPVIDGEAADLTPIRLQRLRLYGGIELIEPGLTLAVFPFHSSYTSKIGTVSHNMHSKSMHYEEQGLRSTLGRADDEYFSTHACFKVIVQLYFRDSVFNVDTKINSLYVRSNNVTNFEQYGQLLTLDTDADHDFKYDQVVEESSIDVQILPGEEILKDYMPILRGVVRDIPVLKPFCVRNPTILCTDYPTSNYLKDSENLVFHSAYIVVQYDITEPKRASDYCLPGVREVLICNQKPPVQEYFGI